MTALLLGWFTIEVSVEHAYCSPSWPDGIWSRYTKKYSSLRRAKQALPYVVAQVPEWGVRIVTCPRPVGCEERLRLGIPPFDRGEAVETHLPKPKTL